MYADDETKRTWCYPNGEVVKQRKLKFGRGERLAEESFTTRDGITISVIYNTDCPDLVVTDIYVEYLNNKVKLPYYQGDSVKQDASAERYNLTEEERRINRHVEGLLKTLKRPQGVQAILDGKVDGKDAEESRKYAETLRGMGTIDRLREFFPFIPEHLGRCISEEEWEKKFRRTSSQPRRPGPSPHNSEDQRGN